MIYLIKAISFDIGNTLIKSSGKISLLKEFFDFSSQNTEIIRRAYKEHFLTRQISLKEFCEKTKLNESMVFEKINRHYEKKAPAKIWGDVPIVLEKLKSSNIILIAISNKSYMNPNNLASYGLDLWFEKEIYSCDVGYAKPDTFIFQYAQCLLKMNPNEILHIGDSYTSDYMGAKKASWNSILLNRGCEQKNECLLNVPIINSLSELIDYLV